MTQLNTGEPNMPDQMPPWLEWVRGDIKDFRAEMNTRLDKFVTEEAMNLRMESVHARIDAQGSEIALERADRAKGDKVNADSLREYRNEQDKFAAEQKSNRNHQAGLIWGMVGTVFVCAATVLGSLIAAGVIK